MKMAASATGAIAVAIRDRDGRSFAILQDSPKAAF
jgi:hypothetical protein